jgi:hypothetical protein
VTQTLSFAAGEMSKTVQVAVTDDSVFEMNETVLGVISDASTGTIATATVSVSINDNEQSVWSVAAATEVVDEGAGFITYTVSRTGAGAAATINFNTAGGTATAGSDYTALTQTLSFAAGEMSKTVQVAIADDSVLEVNETVVGSISAASAGTIAVSTASATINDNEQSVWSVAAATTVVDEYGGFLIYTVSRTGAGAAATINFNTAGGTATAGSDYTAVAQTLSFAAGEMSKSVFVPVLQDSEVELGETVVGVIEAASVGTIDTASANATIRSNDESLWSIAEATSEVDEGAGFVTYEVSRTGSTAAATIEFNTAGGTATAGSDYTAVTQILSFAAGETSKIVRVSIADDGVAEGNETVVAAIANPSTGALLVGSNHFATVTINDNDQSVWSVAAATAVVDEGAGFITYTVSRTGAGAAATINFNTAGGTATAGSDYTALTQTLSFAAGEMSKTVQVAITDDSVLEVNQTVVGSISAASAGTIAVSTASATINDNEQSVWSVAAATTAVDEGAGFITYTVSRTGAGAAATINFNTAGGTATAGSDYTAVTQTLSFAAGEMSKTVLVAITDDNLAEPNETVLGSIVGASVGSIDVGSVSTTIRDNEQSIWSLATSTSTVNESAGFIAYTVTRTGSTAAATIDFSTASGTATGGSDYTAGTQTLSFAAGEMLKTVFVSITDDSLAEANETLAAVITNASSGTIITPSGTSGTGNSLGQTTVRVANVTIIDNDQSLWSVAASTASADEGAGFISYTVSRTGAGAAATIQFNTAGGTATAGIDYTALAQTLSFAVGEMSKTVLVAVTDDGLPESDETIGAVISNASEGSIVTANINATVLDNDLMAWTVSSTSEASESAGKVAFVVSRNLGGTQETIRVATMNSNEAILGLDYTALDQVLTFAVGEVTKTVYVDLLPNTVDGNRTILVGVDQQSQGLITGSGVATTLVVDDDASFWYYSNGGDVDEGAGSVVYLVSRTGASDAATIRFQALPGTATAGSDFTAMDQILSFAAGEMSKMVTIAIADDALAEGNESLFVVLTDPSLGTVSRGLTNRQPSNIIDNDLMQWSLANTGTIGEGAGYVVFTVTRSGDISSQQTIDFSTGGGTATAGADYTALAQTLTFAAGEITKTVMVAVTDDGLGEGSETVGASISNASLGSIVTGTSSVSVTDNDVSIWAVANTSNGYASGSTQVSFSVTRSGNIATQATIDVDTTIVNGVQGSAANYNYTPIHTTLTFAAGQTSTNVVVDLDPTNYAGFANMAQYLGLVLSNASADGIIATPFTGNPGDNSNLPKYTAIQGNLQISESGGYLTVYVIAGYSSLTHASTVQYTTVIGGTATPGLDYEPVSGILTFQPGESFKTILIPIYNDALLEGNETVQIALFNPVDGVNNPFQGNPAGITILELNQALWTVTSSSNNSDEGAGYTVFTVSRSGNTTAAATIEFNTTGGTATPGADYSATSQLLSFAAGETVKTVRVAIANDGVQEQTETIIATISNASLGSITTANATANLLDNDLATWAVGQIAGGVSYEADGYLFFSVTRSGNLSNSATIDVATFAGTASQGVDYTALSQTLSFVAGESSKVVKVALLNENLGEINETLLLGISNPSSGVVTTANATGTILDEEITRFTMNSVPNTGGIPNNTSSGFENLGAFTVIVQRTGNLTTSATVDWAMVGTNYGLNYGVAGTADFAQTFGTVTFAAGENAKFITLTPITDGLAEVDETVSLILTGATASSGVAVVDTATYNKRLSDTDRVNFAIYNEGQSISESQGVIRYSVVRSGNVDVAASIDWALAGGTAQAADLSGSTSGTLSFAAGERTKVITLNVVNDSLFEANETVTVTLLNPSASGANAAIVAPSPNTTITPSATNTIVDDDRMDYAVAAVNSSVTEGTTALVFSVTRSGNTAGAGTVDWAVVGTTVTSADVSGAFSGTVSFAAGETTKLITINVIDDSLSEQSESITVALSNAVAPVGVVANISTSTSSANIVDNDLVSWTVGGGSLADEEAGRVAFTITRTGNLSQAATIEYSTTGVGAPSGIVISGKDNTAATGILSFAAGEQTKLVYVDVSADTLGEASENLILGISNASIGTITTSLANAQITDNDLVTWAVSGGLTSDESTGKMAFTITRSGNLQQVATIDYSTTGQGGSTGNAIAGVDYAAVFGTLTFAAGEQTKTVLVSITDDVIGENSETVFLGISNASTGTISTTSASNTIADNDLVTWAITGQGAADEGMGKMAFTITRSGNLQQAATIDYGTTGGGASSSTAIAGKDFSAIFGTLTFSAGEQVKTVVVDITNDTLGEASETVTMAIANASTGSITTGSASNAITDNDLTTWSVATAASSNVENLGYLSFVVSRSGNLQVAATIDYSTAGGTGVPGLDYSAISGTLSFAAGEQTKTVFVNLLDDTIAESTETVGLVLANASTGSIASSAASTATVNISDNEQGVSTFAIAALQGGAWEGAGYALFSITRSGDVLGTQTIVFDTTTAGTATSGSDFSAVTSTIYTFAPGETVKVVKVAVTQDVTAEANETIQGRIGGVSSGSITTATVTATIWDDDGGLTGYDGNASAPSFAVGAVQANTWEGAGYALFTITRNGDMTGTHTVDFATNAVGTATAGTDFTAVTATTYTFAPGETVKVVKVAIATDSSVEANETIQGVLTNATGGASIGTATTNITILDDDATLAGNPSTPSFAVTALQSSVWESDGYAYYQITRSNDVTQTQTVNFATNVAGTATAGTDFTAVSATTYTFVPGESVKVVRVALIGDVTAEANETIQAVISGPTGGAVLGTSTANVTVFDDDGGTTGYDGSATAPAFAIGTGQATIFESAGLIQYTVTRSNEFTGTQTVNWSITGGTATAGSDFVTGSGTLTFAPGEVTKTFSISMTNDSVWEGSETVIATIAAPSAGTIGTATSTVTIVDTDWITDTLGASTSFTLGTSVAANTGTFIDASDGADTIVLGITALAYAQVQAGSGDDIFTLNSPNPVTNGVVFDGGSGVDLFNITSSLTLNFQTLADTVLRGFERINFGNTNSAIQLGLEDVLALTSGNSVTNTLRFENSGTATLNLQTLGRTLNTPNVGDSVTDVDGSTYVVAASTGVGAQNNASANDVVIGGRTYDVYQYNYNSQLVSLLIDTSITKVVL